MKNILTCGSSANRYIITGMRLFGCWCGVLSQGYQNPSGAGTRKNKTEVQRGITPWDATWGDACQCTWEKNNPKHRCTRRRNLEIGRWRLRSDGQQYIVHESAMGNSSEETKAVQHRAPCHTRHQPALQQPTPRTCFQSWAHWRDVDTLEADHDSAAGGTWPGWNDSAGAAWDAGVGSTLPASRTVEHGAAGGCTGAWMLGWEQVCGSAVCDTVLEGQEQSGAPPRAHRCWC